MVSAYCAASGFSLRTCAARPVSYTHLAAAAFDLPYGGLTKPGPAYDKMIEAMQEVIDLSVLEGVNLPADNQDVYKRQWVRWASSLAGRCPA